MSDAERRRFFRIFDDVALSIWPARNTSPSSTPEHDPTALPYAFAEMTRKLHRQVEGSRSPSPDVAAYLEGVHSKLDMLATWLAARELGLPAHPTHRVELSASGVSLTYAETLEHGSVMEVRLLLFPDWTCVRMQARVVRAQPNPAGGFDVALDFIDPDEDDCDVLAAHVTRRQAEQLRARNRAD